MIKAPGNKIMVNTVNGSLKVFNTNSLTNPVDEYENPNNYFGDLYHGKNSILGNDYKIYLFKNCGSSGKLDEEIYSIINASSTVTNVSTYSTSLEEYSLNTFTSYKLTDTDRVLIYRDGYITTKGESDGSVSYTWTDKVLLFHISAQNADRPYPRPNT